MKAILFASFLITSLFAKTFPVNIREGKKIITKQLELENLESEKVFEGKYFKIVKALETDAVSFSDNQETIKRAATVYYHLNIARDYFKAIMPQNQELDKQMIIRIEKVRKWDSSIHSVKGEYQYNGSLSVPASSTLANIGEEICYGENNSDCKIVEPWENEIWFFAPKLIKESSTVEMATNYIDSPGYKKMLLGNLLYADFTQFMFSAFQKEMVDDLLIEQHLYSMAMSIGLTAVLPKVLKYSAKLFKTKRFLDSAMIPEIIYHEYSHIALSTFLSLGNSTAIGEGFSNYFAYKMSKVKKLGANSKKYYKGELPKKINSKVLYSIEQDAVQSLAWGSFTFSLLGKLDVALGEESEVILLKSLEYLNGHSNLRFDFTKAVLSAIDEVGKNKLALKIAALNVFQEKGL